MTKFLRFKKAASNRVYIDIVADAVERLTAHGFFVKDDVLIRTGYDAGMDIRWDYVRRMIEEQYDTELIPLGPSFLKRHPRSDEKRFTTKFVAGGNGRGCVAYAIASEANGHFVIQRLRMKQRMAQGFTTAAESTARLAKRLGVLSEVKAPDLIEYDDTLFSAVDKADEKQ